MTHIFNKQKRPSKALAQPNLLKARGNEIFSFDFYHLKSIFILSEGNSVYFY